jgi:hypothetical protein
MCPHFPSDRWNSIACVPGGHPPDHVDTHQRTLSDALSSQPVFYFCVRGNLINALIVHRSPEVCWIADGICLGSDICTMCGVFTIEHPVMPHAEPMKVTL